ncbi:exodeoxyribonuclease III [Pseudolysobacter antarcticus]|uniref:Exodeoxyribonuclease III n=1 Tax=Pseudolysobacter antarcticus TaxID=2511995 RepID=A0A411HPQ9_9GAMM|nr:exodeoxyribonuclease III [Pseudolysobacter antarcticus]QBB72489.1 exodeoxyribonuclease III [Pseudolysobacter antarcticus]
MKIATWNVNSLNVRLPHLLEWLRAATPDIVALQETKLEDARFPAAAISELGYHCVYSGQKTYNGVALLSREPARDVLTDIPGLDDPQRRILVATIGDLRIVNLYVVNGQDVGTEKYAYKLDWLKKVTAFLREELQRHPRLIVLGDFNIVPEDRDIYDPEAWRGKILCSEPERAALQGLFDLGLHDSFRLFQAEAGHYSWWDYRQAGYRRNLGLRIDLILASAALRERCRGASIDGVPRGWERPSDHTPALLELSDD